MRWFRPRARVTDTPVEAFVTLVDKYTELAKCARDGVDLRVKEFLAQAIEEQGIPAAEAYYTDDIEVTEVVTEEKERYQLPPPIMLVEQGREPRPLARPKRRMTA